ncbi:MAG: response regulator [Planctomycetota bacterium]
MADDVGSELGNMSRLILVVDDDPLILRLVEGLLVHANHRVHCVGNGKLAAEQIDAIKPDLILSDLEMPEMGGLELVRMVAKRHPELPVVVFTGRGGEEEAVRCFRAGAADYVSKTKLREELVEVVHRILNDREMSAGSAELLAVGDNDKGGGGADIDLEENFLGLV